MERTEIKINRKHGEITLFFEKDIDHKGRDYFDMKARDYLGNTIWDERYNRVFENESKFNAAIKRYAQ